MLFIDRSHVQLEPMPGTSSPSPTGESSPPSPPPAAPGGVVVDSDAFRERVLAVLEGALRDMERRGAL